MKKDKLNNLFYMALSIVFAILWMFLIICALGSCSSSDKIVRQQQMEYQHKLHEQARYFNAVLDSLMHEIEHSTSDTVFDSIWHNTIIRNDTVFIETHKEHREYHQDKEKESTNATHKELDTVFVEKTDTLIQTRNVTQTVTIRQRYIPWQMWVSLIVAIIIAVLSLWLLFCKKR